MIWYIGWDIMKLDKKINEILPFMSSRIKIRDLCKNHPYVIHNCQKPYVLKKWDNV